MESSNKGHQRIRIYRRETLTGARRYLHYHEVHLLFDELIYRPWGGTRWNPAVDVWEKQDAFTIEIDLPGIEAEDVYVVVRNSTISVEGERQLRKSHKQGIAHVCERPQGKFVRIFDFDYEIDADRVETTCRDGVLTIVAPKTAKTRDHYYERNAGNRE
jgi:HSP20 family molecular chaperone IbpA